MRALLRPSLIAAWLLPALVLTACQMQAPDRAPLATDEISVTSLDAPASGDRVPVGPPALTEGDAPRPEPRPDTLEEPADDTAPSDDAAPISEPPISEPAAETPAEPEAPKSPEQVSCEKTGGQWSVAGVSGAYVCFTPTRDGGKSCRKKTDCEGLCLARSGTCAPIKPLFGCNEVLEKDGRRVTLCID